MPDARDRAALDRGRQSAARARAHGVRGHDRVGAGQARAIAGRCRPSASSPTSATSWSGSRRSSRRTSARRAPGPWRASWPCWRWPGRAGARARAFARAGSSGATRSSTPSSPATSPTARSGLELRPPRLDPRARPAARRRAHAGAPVPAVARRAASSVPAERARGRRAGRVPAGGLLVFFARAMLAGARPACGRQRCSRSSRPRPRTARPAMSEATLFPLVAGWWLVWCVGVRDRRIAAGGRARPAARRHRDAPRDRARAAAAGRVRAVALAVRRTPSAALAFPAGFVPWMALVFWPLYRARAPYPHVVSFVLDSVRENGSLRPFADTIARNLQPWSHPGVGLALYAFIVGLRDRRGRAHGARAISAARCRLDRDRDGRDLRRSGAAARPARLDSRADVPRPAAARARGARVRPRVAGEPPRAPRPAGGRAGRVPRAVRPRERAGSRATARSTQDGAARTPRSSARTSRARAS